MVRRPNIATVEDLKGSPVVNPSGADLGTVDDFVLDLERGQVAYAVLSLGGFMGMGAKLHPVPWEALALQEGKFVLNLQREALPQAPSLERRDLGRLADPRVATQVYRFYGHRPYWEVT